MGFPGAANNGASLRDNMDIKNQKPVALTTSAVVIFTAQRKTKIRELKAANYHASNASVPKFYVGVNGFTPSDAANLYAVKSLAAVSYEDFIKDGNFLVLNKGDQISALASAATVNVTISYEEEK